MNEALVQILFAELKSDIKNCAMEIAGGNGMNIKDALDTLEFLEKEVTKE